MAGFTLQAGGGGYGVIFIGKAHQDDSLSRPGEARDRSYRQFDDLTFN